MPSNGQTKDKITFDDHVRPLFERRCSVCHNSDRREGDLDLTSFVNLMQGGGSGSVLESGDPTGSYLYSLVTHTESPEMPPSGSKIPKPEIDLIAAWINGGLLENSGSKAAKVKPKVSLALDASPTTRPEVAPTPFRISLEPVITPPVGSVLALAANPWAPVIAVSTPKQILLYRSDRLELVGVLPNEIGVAQSLKFNRNGELLLAGGGRPGKFGSVLMYNARTGELMDRIGQERDSILTADLSADQSMIATGGPSKRVNLLNLAGEVVHELSRHTDWVTALGFSPDGQFLATADRDGSLLLWEADSGLFVQKFGGHAGAITSLEWRSDSKLFVTAGEDGSVRVWNARNPKPVRSWTAHGEGALSAGFRRDGSIYSAGRDRLVKLWQADGKPIRVFKGLQDIVVAATVCDETNRVFAADWTGKLIVWNADDGKILQSLSTNPPALATRLSKAKIELEQWQSKATTVAAKCENLQMRIAKCRASRKACDEQCSQNKSALNKLAVKESKLHFQRRRSSLANLRRMQSLSAEQTKLKKLNAALEQSKLALSNLPDDQQLLDTVVYLQSEIRWQAELVEQFVSFAVGNFREHARAGSKLRDVQHQAALIAETRDQRMLQVTALKQRLDKLSSQLKQQSKAGIATAEEVAVKQNLVNRWQEEIRFDQKLKQLRNQLEASEAQWIVTQESVKQAQQERKLADQKVIQAKQASDESRAAADAIRKQLRQLRE